MCKYIVISIIILFSYYSNAQSLTSIDSMEYCTVKYIDNDTSFIDCGAFKVEVILKFEVEGNCFSEENGNTILIKIACPASYGKGYFKPGNVYLFGIKRSKQFYLNGLPLYEI